MSCHNINQTKEYGVNDLSIEATPYFMFFYPFHRKPHILDFVIALEKILNYE